MFHRLLAYGLAALICAPAAAQEQKLSKAVFATNWLPEAEHGGFYQALADGTYARYGLDVTIVPGGPQSTTRLLLAAGKADFYMGQNMIAAFDAVKEKMPSVVVAAMFQKDPVVLMSHPGQNLDRLDDLPNADKAYIAKDYFISVWQWLKKDRPFKDAVVRPYAFNAAPFLADKKSIQQGYASAEPFEIERQGGFKPNVFLLADYGYDSYSTTIETRQDVIEKRPDFVQSFVDASIIGWCNYIYGDNSAGNALIKKQNPDMSDEQIAFSVARMRADGIVDSGDSKNLGIGAMTDSRMKRIFDILGGVGVVSPDLNYSQAYTTRFVNKGVTCPARSQ